MANPSQEYQPSPEAINAVGGIGQSGAHIPAPGTKRDQPVGNRVWHYVATGDGSWTIDPQNPYTDHDPSKEPTARQEAPPVIGDDRTGKWAYNQQTGKYDIPVLAATPPNWTMHQLGDGTLIAVNPQDPSKYAVIANPTPAQQAQVAATLAQTQAQTAQSQAQTQASGVNSAVAVNTDARATQKQNYDQYAADIAQRISIGEMSDKQGMQAMTEWVRLNYEQPRQAVADANSARTAQINAASVQQQSNLSRENTAQQAGTSAVNDAQFAAQHGVNPDFYQARDEMIRDPQHYQPRDTSLPMPNFGQIRAQGEQGVRDRVAPFEQTNAQQQPYGTFVPNTQGEAAFWNANVAPAQAFGVQQPAPFQYPPPQYGARFLPPPPPVSQIPMDSPARTTIPWFGDPRDMPPDWGMEAWRNQRQTSPRPNWQGMGGYPG